MPAKLCIQIWQDVRRQKPLIHCITNYVTVNDVANVLLAGGASPAMVENPAESGDFAAIANALYLNLGTMTMEQEDAMLEAVKGAGRAGIPVVLDPVACGVIPRKTDIINRLAQAGNIAVIKGNMAEIKALAGMQGRAQGVDSLDSGEGAADACLTVARKYRSVVVATGAVDVVAQGSKVYYAANGTEFFTAITGAGCMVGALVAAALAVTACNEWYAAALAALSAFNLAGEQAAAVVKAPGSFRLALLDNLYLLNDEIMSKGIRINA